MEAVMWGKSKRAHLRAVDLDQVPVSGPPVIVPHRSAGELIGSKVDEMIKSSNRVVDLECELDKARNTLREHQLELAEAVKQLGMPPEVVATIMSRRN
jgi:hypothetical protein